MLSTASPPSLPAFQNLLDDVVCEEVSAARDPVLSRVRQILDQQRRGGPIFGADLAVLLRQVLLAHSSNGRKPRLTIRDSSITTDWAAFGLRATKLGAATLLEPLVWQPDWLGPFKTPETDVFADVFAGRTVRIPSERAIDPCIREATGYGSYVCPGQREAVRSLLYMPAGSTLIVNLPTGSGKTLVGQLPPLLSGSESGLTIFVVPTTALALDQARRMRDILSQGSTKSELHNLAWHADLPTATKIAIKLRIRNGTQGILFASPEAVRGALLPALYDASSSGMLRYLVIDEAHMICEWGDGFRPDFQALAGVRSGLLRHCGGERFRTVLMSATLTPETIHILEALFGQSGDIQMVAAVHLRPEPRYWSYCTPSLNEKIVRVRELVKHAPRPFLLYVTEPRQAEEWLNLLQDDGFRRIDAFHGNTPNARREAIIANWAENRLDGIVATSAFGVGMDKSDVRTVIHATVPETLDRYYQEVGRAGRDGRASISIAVYAQDDIRKARSLGRPRLIGDDNAFERWRTMFGRSKGVSGSNDLVEIDLTVVPPRLYQESDYNKAWNIRTLILMARSGLIKLDSIPPTLPERLPDEIDATFDARVDAIWERYFNTILVRIVDHAHLQPAHFERRTEVDRERAANAADRSFGSLIAALDGQREMGSVLADLYSNNEPDQTVIVSRSCRGCRADPSEDHLPYSIPAGASIRRVERIDLSNWSSRFPYLSGRVTILFLRDDSSLEQKLERAFASLVGTFGVAEVTAPQLAWKNYRWLSVLHQRTPRRTLIARTIEEGPPAPGTLPLPTATLLWPWEKECIPDQVLLLQRPLHVIFAPNDLPGEHPLRRFAETAERAITLDNFLMTATR